MPNTKFNFTRLFTAIAIVAVVVLIFSSLTSNVQAVTGINRQINFQGKLVNNPTSTNVNDTSYTVIFTFYDAPSGGTALWTETQTVTTKDGIFRVALGSVTPFPANFNFNWSGLYLGIKVNSDSEMTPRIQMAAVPFAFNSEKVAGLTVQDTSGNASTSGTLQIANAKTFNLGTNNLTFTTSGDTTLTLPTSGTVCTTITCLTSAINWWNQVGGLVYPTSSLYDFVIGGTATTSALFSYTGIQSTGHQTTASISGNLVIKPNNGYGGQILLGGGLSSDFDTLTATTLTIGASKATGITIGAAATSLTLHGVVTLPEYTGVDNAVLYADSSTGQLSTVTGTSTSGKCLLSGVSTVPSWGTCPGGSAGVNWWNQLGGLVYPTDSTYDFAVGGSATSSALFSYTGIQSPSHQTIASVSGELIVMPNNGFGNVGINVTNPRERLQIAGNLEVSAAAAGAKSYRFRTSGGALDFEGAGADMYFSMWSGTDFTGTQDFFLLLNSDTHIANAHGDWQFQTGNTGGGGNVILSLNGDSTGNVGVNTSSPLVAFDVRGNSGTTAVASVSAKTSYATLVVNNDGVGDLIAASQSGWERFTVKNDGSINSYGTASIGSTLTFKTNGGGTIQTSSNQGLVFGGNSTGGISFLPNNGLGGVGVNNSSALASLDIVGSQNFSSMTVTGAVSASSGSNGNVDSGTHSWKVTFVSAAGGETTPGALSNQLNVNNPGKQVSLINIPTGPFGTTARKIYRTVSGDTGSYLLVTTISDNSTTSTTDNVADASLGAAAPASNTTAVANIQTGGVTRLVISNIGNVGIGNITPLAVLHVEGAYGSNAEAIINQLNSGDILTGSTSGQVKFRFANTGQLDLVGNLSSDIDTLTATKLTIGGVTANQLVLGNSTITSMTFNIDTAGNFVFQKEGSAFTCSGTDKLTLNGSGQLICSSDVSGGGGVNWWNQLGGLVYPADSNYDFAVGGTATSSALFSYTGIKSAGHQTTASISGNLVIMPNNGYGGSLDLATYASIGSVLNFKTNGGGTIQASSNQQLVLGGTTTGNIILNPLNGSGYVGISTSSPQANLDISGSIPNGQSIILLPEITHGSKGITINTSSPAGSSLTGTYIDLSTSITRGISSSSLDSRKYLNINRNDTISSGLSGGIDYNSDLVSFASNCATTGNASCSDEGHILSLTQNFGLSTGDVLGITTVGQGQGLDVSANSGGQAAVVINKTVSSGDILTASSSGVPKFTVANNGSVTIGNTTNGLVFDTTAGPTYYGTGRSTKQIVISPEYAGAIITASGSATTNGSMTSDASASAALSNYRTYYEWSSTQNVPQNYTVAVRVTLPQDFSDFDSTANNAMKVNYQTASSATTANHLDVYVYNGDTSLAKPGNPVILRQNLNSTTWTSTNIDRGDLIDNAEGFASPAAGDTMMIYLTMTASGTYNITRVGDIVINYKSKF